MYITFYGHAQANRTKGRTAKAKSERYRQQDEGTTSLLTYMQKDAKRDLRELVHGTILMAWFFGVTTARHCILT